MVGGQGKKEVEVTLAFFTPVPGKVVMLRRKNGSGGGNSGSREEYTSEAGSGEAGDAQKTTGNGRVKLGRNVSSMSRELGVTQVWNCLLKVQ